MNNPHILITGGAGFIGSHLSEKLVQGGNRVSIIDNFDPFYDKKIKVNNIKTVMKNSNFSLIEGDICNGKFLDNHFPEDVDQIVHLAAKAGVRPSIADPISYQTNNVLGTQNILEQARRHGVKQFVFGSSSSVYGVNKDVPWKESNVVLKPISPYASSKVSCELLGHVYSHLYNIRFIALRFFTVYGPRQRPDLAIHKFFNKIENDVPVPVYGDGSTYRDYTYVEDILQGICASLEYTASDYEIINIGNCNTISLTDLIDNIEQVIGKKAIKKYLPQQPGDVPKTYADITKAKELLDYNPSTIIADGLKEFYNWYRKESLV